MVAYTGALQPKKKGELQEIAQALAIQDSGTKDELQARIKKHLDAHQDALEEDPVFAGLFGRRKRSVQPQPAPVPLPAALAGRFAPSATGSSPTPDAFSDKPRSSRRSAALESIKEYSSSAKDVAGVVHDDLASVVTVISTPKKSIHPLIGDDADPLQLPLPPTPSSLVAHAAEVVESPVKKLIDAVANSRAVAVGEEAKDAVVKRLKHTQQVQMQGGAELVVALRGFLSNSRNIWSLTSCIELLYILGVTIPWQFAEIPLGNAPTSPSLTLPFPPLSALRAPALWTVLLHWALPTLLLPALVGCLVSFDPALKRIKPTASSTEGTNDGAVVLSRSSTPAPAPGSSSPSTPPSHSTTTTSSADLAPLDPLTAAIARLFLAGAYPYASVAARAGVVGVDVLGGEWRTRSAALGLACAFAEAVGRAPGVAIGLAGRGDGGAGMGMGVQDGGSGSGKEGGKETRKLVTGGRMRRALAMHRHQESPEVD